MIEIQTSNAPTMTHPIPCFIFFIFCFRHPMNLRPTNLPAESDPLIVIFHRNILPPAFETSRSLHIVPPCSPFVVQLPLQPHCVSSLIFFTAERSEHCFYPVFSQAWLTTFAVMKWPKPTIDAPADRPAAHQAVRDEKRPEETSQATSGAGSLHEPEKVVTHDDEDPEAAERVLSRIPTSDYPHGFKLAFIVMALVLSIFLVSLDMTIVATAIPRITDEFHSLDQVGWYGSAFFLTLASFQSTWGKAYKYFKLKPTFLVSIAIFELGSLICGVAQDSTTLIVGRAIAGT